MEAVKGSQLDRCGYPLSGLPREPPGVRVPLQLHHRRPGQHSPVHSSTVVGDPWRPDSHLPTPAPPPFLTGAVTRMVCPLGPPVYAGSSTATRAPSPGRLQGRAALSAPRSPSSCRLLAPWAEGPVQDSTTCASGSHGVWTPQSCAQGARPRASCSRGAAGSMSVTTRRRVQTEYSPGGLSVRLP